jgi:hypothetical protein
MDIDQIAKLGAKAEREIETIIARLEIETGIDVGKIEYSKERMPTFNLFRDHAIQAGTTERTVRIILQIREEDIAQHKYCREG